MNDRLAIAIAALTLAFRDFGASQVRVRSTPAIDPRRWKRGFGARHARGPLKPLREFDALEECQRLDGAAFRHRITGEVRRFVHTDERYGRVLVDGDRSAFYRSPRKALAWIGNADRLRGGL